jgi:hypothetical protein
LDSADQTLPSRGPAAPAKVLVARPKPRKPPAAMPARNRQERVISTAYLVMLELIVAFLLITGLLAWLGA